MKHSWAEAKKLLETIAALDELEVYFSTSCYWQSNYNNKQGTSFFYRTNTCSVRSSGEILYSKWPDDINPTRLVAFPPCENHLNDFLKTGEWEKL